MDRDFLLSVCTIFSFFFIDVISVIPLICVSICQLLGFDDELALNTLFIVDENWILKCACIHFHV